MGTRARRLHEVEIIDSNVREHSVQSACLSVDGDCGSREGMRYKSCKARLNRSSSTCKWIIAWLERIQAVGGGRVG